MNTPPAAPPAKWSRPLLPQRAAVGDAFAALCHAALAQIAANAPGVARGDEPEYLHQLRGKTMYRYHLKDAMLQEDEASEDG